MWRRSVRLLKRFVPVASVALLLLVVALAWEIRRLDAVTTPDTPIDVGTQTALLVLDVQEEYTGASALSPFPYPGSEQLIRRINAVARRSADAGVHVLYVRQVYSSALGRLVSRLLLGKRGWPGSAGASLDRRLELVSKDIAEKPGADAFSSAEVRAFLRAHGVGKLWLVGLDGAGCIDRTARGARARGLEVTVLDDAVATLDAAKLQELRADYAALDIAVVPAATRLGSE